MTQNITLRSIVTMVMNFVVLFVFSFVVASCTTEDFPDLEPNKPTQPEVKGDTIISFDGDILLLHEDFVTSNGLVNMENKLDGYIKYSSKKNGVESLIKLEPFQQKLPMTIKWTALEETSGAAQMEYVGAKVSDAKNSTSKNGNLTITTYNKVATLEFVEGNVEFAVSYDVASLGNQNAPYCRFDRLEVVEQLTDTISSEVIKKEDGDYMRAKTTAKVRAYLTDMPENEVHTKDFTMEYSKVFRVNIEPGEKIYVGKSKVEGSEKYYRLENGNFYSEVTYTLIYTQDGKTIKEEETFSGEAKVTWNLPSDNVFTVKDINIGNPSMKASYEDAKEAIKKGENVEAIVRNYSFPFAWENGYVKNATASVERLYGVMNGDTFPMPTADSSMEFTSYVSGEGVANNDFTVYQNGVLYFAGEHAGETFDLSVAQVFQIKKDRQLLGYEFLKDFNPETGISTIQVVEKWLGEADKYTDKYTTTLSSKTYGEDVQRFYGSELTFISGLNKEVQDGDYKAEGNNIYKHTVKTTWTATLSFGYSCVYNEVTEAYVMIGERKVYFKGFDAVNFSNCKVNLVNTNYDFVENDDNYIRRTYEVVFGEIINTIVVDEAQAKNPTTDNEWGVIDWTKTKQFGGLSWAWDFLNGALTPLTNATIITSKGVVTVINGEASFYQMDVNTITERLGASLNEVAGNKWIPSTISVMKGNTGNPYWFYQSVDGKSTSSINGVDILKIEGVDLYKPFFETPSDDSTSTYSYNNGHIVIKYNGKVLFDEVFPTM